LPGGLTVTRMAAMPPTSHLAYQPTRPDARQPRSATRTVVVVVAAVALVAGAFVGGFFTGRTGQATATGGERPATMDEAITYGPGGLIEELSWNGYPEGACLNGRLTRGQQITSSAQVDCEQPHELQFYHSETQLRAPQDYEEFPNPEYPDVGLLTAYTEQLCTLVFNSNWLKGDMSNLRYRAVIPTKEQWDGDRSVVCVLYDKDGKQLTQNYVA
jgi:eukaryotic-like serine/threonine-protein kinase